MKKFYSLLAAVALAATVNAQTTVNFVLSSQGYTSGSAVASGSIDANLPFTTSENGSSRVPAYYTNAGGNALRFYYAPSGNGGSMTISPANGAKITSVVIKAASAANATAVKYAVDGGTSTAATLSGTTYTISGINAETSFSFQNANTTNTQLWVTEIDVTYTTPTMAVVDATKGKANLVKNTVVANELIFGAAAKVSVYNTAGQLVKTTEVAENSKLDVSALPKGTYVVTGVVNGQAVSQKVIKK